MTGPMGSVRGWYSRWKAKFKPKPEGPPKTQKDKRRK